MLHDLRNPTQALTLMTELMSGAASDAADNRATILDASRHLGRLLELLDRVLRPLAPRLVPAPGPVALRDVLELVDALGRLHRGRARLEVGVDAAGRLPAVAAESQHLEHVVLALVLNALEALGPAGGIARVTAAVEGGRVELVVEDAGPGVPGSVLPRLFEPFVTTRDRPLAGLGLYAARELLQQSRGTLEYAPAGAGSRFVIGLEVWRR